MDQKKKWMRYEKRWKIRDIYFNKALRRHLIVKYLHREPVMPYFAGQWVMSGKETNAYIAEKIKSGKPFLACRFGNTELSIVTSILKQRIIGESRENTERLEEWFYRSCEGAGFFPADISLAEPFTDIMLEAAETVDLLGMWHLHMEDYVIREYMKQCRLTHLYRLEPWLSDTPWSEALEGKKVLVIHPFEKTIRAQYEKREQIFPQRKVLPFFELQTLKAVQTSAGETDERFKNWFEALEHMYCEAMKIEFDIAIIGCGAYGMPLAGKLKQAGKQAIHLGGATQLLFGIKGRRWEDKNYPTGVSKLFNEAWVYPNEEETPRGAEIVENACYWK